MAITLLHLLLIETRHWQFGGPFSGGVLFMFADGTVRSIAYNQRGTVNLARLMYPSDGQVTSFDN